MPNGILAGDDFPGIRVLLGLDPMDTTSLADETIYLPIFAGVADSQVYARVPDADTRAGTDVTHLHNAASYFTAALLVEALSQLTQEKFDTDYQYTKQPFDRATRAAQLRALADDELDAVVDPVATTSPRPTMFALGRGYRGR